MGGPFQAAGVELASCPDSSALESFLRRRAFTLWSVDGTRSGIRPSRFVSDLRKPTLLAPMMPLVAGWASSPDRQIPLRPFRSDRLDGRVRRMVPVWPTPSLVALAKGEVPALAALLVSMLDDRIHLALFHGLVQSVEHPFGTRALDYCPAHDSATEHASLRGI